MYNTFCDEQGKNQSRMVKGYISTKDSFKLTEVTMSEKARRDFAPAGGIISNLEDLNKWDTKLHNGKILKPETYKVMTNYNITASHEVFGSEKIGYGYGIRISDKTPVKYAGHAGKGLGFVSLKVYFPKKDVNLIVLENQYSENSNLHYYFEIKLREIIMNSDLVK
jgi:CubicO group peptidase (beta-lactamase class C family)